VLRKCEAIRTLLQPDSRFVDKHRLASSFFLFNPTMLMDLIAFVEPLMSFVDFMGAQKTSTSSFIVPRLIAAKVEMERKANELAAVPCREYVAGWYNAFYGDVWQSYLDCFLHDKFLLASTLLDIRIGYRILTNEVLM